MIPTKMKQIGFLICLLIAQLGSCQIGSTKYPTKLIIDTDTVVCFTLEHVQKIRLAKAELDYKSKRVSELTIQYSLLSELNKEYAKSIEDYKVSIELANNLISIKDSINHNNTVTITRMQKVHDKKVKILGGISLVSVGVLLTTLVK